jgi:serpin B
MSALLATLAAQSKKQPKKLHKKFSPVELQAEPKASSVAADNTFINITSLVQQNNHFAADVYKLIAKSDKNCFFSPYSISTALAMTYAGAKGETAEQMQKALRWTQGNTDVFHQEFGALQSQVDKSNSEKLITKVANRIWANISTKLAPDFVEQNTKYYGAGVERIDFNKSSAAPTINRWVESQTNNLIKDLLKPDDVKGAELVLVNAIYFYGEWLLAFDKEQSMDMNFTTSTGEVVQTKFMTMRNWSKKTDNKTFKYTEDDNVQVLELPYEDNKASMVVVLPKPNYSLAQLIEDLDESKIQTWQQNLANLRYKLNLYLPKWKIIQQFSLTTVLKKMGMNIPFTEAADFSSMVQNNVVKISDVIHKAFVEVSEKGTEAAAATAVIIKRTTSVEPREEVKINFVADHPFLYYIKDNATGSILFMGHINNPK